MVRPQVQQAGTPRGLSTSNLNRTQRVASAADEADEYPVRDYIAGMARELAQMARWDGDEVLAVLLEGAVSRAEGVRP